MNEGRITGMLGFISQAERTHFPPLTEEGSPQL